MTVDVPRETGWRSRYTATRAAAEARLRYEEGEPAWRPCSCCWGQRRIYDERMVPMQCPVCLGIGEEMDE